MASWGWTCIPLYHCYGCMYTWCMLPPPLCWTASKQHFTIHCLTKSRGSNQDICKHPCYANVQSLGKSSWMWYKASIVQKHCIVDRLVVDWWMDTLLWLNLILGTVFITFTIITHWMSMSTVWVLVIFWTNITFMETSIQHTVHIHML